MVCTKKHDCPPAYSNDYVESDLSQMYGIDKQNTAFKQHADCNPIVLVLTF